jgi:hypothetical protein
LKGLSRKYPPGQSSVSSDGKNENVFGSRHLPVIHDTDRKTDKEDSLIWRI